ncbi:hypothetical protein EG329_011123 [Mollisiaceae sp. DMI_Dod_QoI]|nr:hypothetical protein EG329_011123 [Helotiales sp. DMI_Dod_QoI]
MERVWIEESETGRWYFNYTDENGRIARAYSDPVPEEYPEDQPRIDEQYLNESISPTSKPEKIHRIPKTSWVDDYPKAAVEGPGTYNTESNLTKLRGSKFVGESNHEYSPPQRNASSFNNAGGAARGGSHRRQARVVQGDLTSDHTERLDPSFRIRNTDYATFFQCGRVFKTLWTDTTGIDYDNKSENDQFMSMEKFQVAYGQFVFSKIRRFVVVKRNENRSCLCLPVTSYDGKGYKKRNFNVDEHGPIYSSDEQPSNVPDITKRPLKVRPAKNEELIPSGYYVNYGRTYCVDPNVKVKNLGELDSESRKLLRYYYNEINFFGDDEPSGPSLQSFMPQSRSRDRLWQYYDEANFICDDEASSASLQSFTPLSPSVDLLGIRSRRARTQWLSMVTAPDSRQDLGSTPVIASKEAEFEQSSLARDYRHENNTTNRAPGQRRARRKSASYTSADGQGAYKQDYLTADEDPYFADPWFLDEANESDVSTESLPADSPFAHVVSSEEQNRRAEKHGTMLSDAKAAIEQFAQFPEAQSAIMSRPSSNASLNPVSLAQSTQYSASSTTPDPMYLQRLVNLLINDSDLHDLFEVAMRKITLDKFENNFRRCLHQFSEHLRTEALPALPRSAPRVIRRFSTNAAHIIRRRFEETPQTDTPTNQSTKQSIVLLEPHVVDDIDENEGDEAEDIEADVEEDEWKEDYLQKFEVTIAGSLSFKMLRENFRIFLQSDQVQRAVFECWPVALQLSEILEIKYLVFPDLGRFIESRFPKGHHLGEILTFVGTDEVAEAISCEDYLMRQWPEVARCLVDCIQSFLFANQQSAVENSLGNLSVQLSPVEVTADPSCHAGIIMKAYATYRLHSQIVAAASWLSAVLRACPHQEVCRSHVSVKATSTDENLKRKLTEHPNKVIQITLNPLERIKSPLTCWHSLFPHNVIAYGSPTQPRIEGRGLEIGFANLACASRCLSFIAYEDGLIAHGLKSVLIPMTELKDDDGIQWHFESKTSQGTRKLASIGQILRVHEIRERVKELDPDRLMNRRCFLGWVEKANVVMGTSGYVLESGASRVPLCPGYAHIRRYEFTASVSAMSWATLQGSISRQRVSITNSLSTSQQSDLLDILNGAMDQHCTIFDNIQKRGYLISRASVVLQMAHSMVHQFHYELYEGNRPVSKDDSSLFAQRSFDGASAALVALKQSFRLTVRKQTGGPEYVEENFSEMIARIWHTTSDIGEGLDSTANELNLVGELAPKFVIGVDLQDAVNNTRPMQLHRAEVNQPWTHLRTEHPIVLFCRNILPPILPDSNICKSWATVPPDQNLLVAMGVTMHTLLDRRENGLAKDLDWCASPSLMETHENAGNASIRHVQKLKSLKSRREPLSNEKVRVAIQRYRQGAFIFGNGTERRCCAPSKSSTSNDDQSHGNVNESLRVRSMSRMSSSASATSVEVRNESITTSPRKQDNSVSDGSEPDIDETLLDPSLETPAAQEQPLEVALGKALRRKPRRIDLRTEVK